MNENTKSRGGGCRGVSYPLWLHWHLVGADNAYGQAQHLQRCYPLFQILPKVEALRTSTLGREIANPSELLLLTQTICELRLQLSATPTALSGCTPSTMNQPYMALVRSSIPTLPKDKEHEPTASNTAGISSNHLGRTGEVLLLWGGAFG